MKNNIIREIQGNYKRIESTIVEELFLTVNNHHLTAGTFREKVWKGLFESIIPKKFKIEQGAFLIDYKGNVSNETDLVILDEEYIPYILKNKNIKFIPVEAAIAVVQCKSNKFEKIKIKEWEKTINDLELGYDGFAGSALNAININNGDFLRETRPLKIICETFSMTPKNITEKLKNDLESDLIICAHSKKIKNKNVYESIGNKFTIYNKHKKLGQVAERIVPKLKKNEILDIDIKEFEIKELSLLTLVFQLNQYLMLINNPVFFPHRAYVSMFNKSINGDKEKKNDGNNKRM